MNDAKLNGLIAATYTPMQADGSVNASQIAPMVNHLVQNHVDGLYVCGSTGEGISLTGQERRDVAEHYVNAARASQVPVVVQVGHNSLQEANDLAKHAAQIGADAVSANAPSYFKVTDVDTLVNCMAKIAEGAPDLPFYYYHIPVLTGSNVDVVRFLEAAIDRIPNLVGVKYTAPTVHEYQSCLRWNERRMDVLWGCDEMLLSALAVGAQGAVGSTYNIAAPLYQSIITAFETGNIEKAAERMSRSVDMIRTIYKYPFHSAMKAVLQMQGVECGQCRLPQGSITHQQTQQLEQELTDIGFFDWALTTE